MQKFCDALYFDSLSGVKCTPPANCLEPIARELGAALLFDSQINREPMYIPEPFQENDKRQLEALIKQNSFGTLISVDQRIPIANHLPFLYQENEGEHGVIVGHMAHANPQWRSLNKTQKVLIIFQGAHAYISPSWYNAPGVPTWNYAAAHLYGIPKLIEDKHAVFSIVEQLTKEHESKRPQAWVPNMSKENRSKLLQKIVGFEIEITGIQTKFKLSQNRSVEDQESVIERLTSSGGESGKLVAALMKDNLPR